MIQFNDIKLCKQYTTGNTAVLQQGCTLKTESNRPAGKDSVSVEDVGVIGGVVMGVDGVWDCISKTAQIGKQVTR